MLQNSSSPSAVEDRGGDSELCQGLCRADCAELHTQLKYSPGVVGELIRVPRNKPVMLIAVQLRQVFGFSRGQLTPGQR